MKRDALLISGFMKSNCSAVAGFFEDLPVLMFVLSGVVALVLTSVFVSARMTTERMDAELDDIAERIVNSISSEMLYSCGPGIMPTVASICAHNYSELLAQLSEGRGFVLSVFSVHPHFSCLLSTGIEPRGIVRSTGYASEMINALSDDGLIVILEVRVIAWQEN